MSHKSEYLLKHFQFNNLEEARSVLHQVTCALAIAEQAMEFEHRDLHWGNVLVKCISDCEDISCCLHGEMVAVPACGVKVAIIDFTLSRLSKGMFSSLDKYMGDQLQSYIIK